MSNMEIKFKDYIYFNIHKTIFSYWILGIAVYYIKTLFDSGLSIKVVIPPFNQG